MKKSLKALLLAMVLVMVPVASFAAGSTSTSSSSSRSNSSNSGGGGGGGGSSSSSSSTSSTTYVAGGPSGSTTTTSGGIIETTNTVVTTESGSTYDAGIVYYDPATGITIALVAEKTSDEKETENPATTYVTGGEAKRAGLPENVVAALDAADNGNLSGISEISGLDMTGITNLGPTLAARNEAGGAATIYCSGITAENAGRLIVLCYNNWTQAISYLTPTSIDVENQMVHCQIPTSCTLQLLVLSE